MFFLRLILCIFAILFFIHSEFSYASASKKSDKFIRPLCNIVKKIGGPWGKALLVIGAIFVGVNVFIGKFSFTMLIGFIAAGALILSPIPIIRVLAGGTFTC